MVLSPTKQVLPFAFSIEKINLPQTFSFVTEPKHQKVFTARSAGFGFAHAAFQTRIR